MQSEGLRESGCPGEMQGISPGRVAGSSPAPAVCLGCGFDPGLVPVRAPAGGDRSVFLSHVDVSLSKISKHSLP